MGLNLWEGLERFVAALVRTAEVKFAANRPMWAHPGMHTRRKVHRADPFQSSRRRGPGEFTMHIEEFPDREARNQRYHELKEQGVRHLSKMTTQRGGYIVWQLLKP